MKKTLDFLGTVIFYCAGPVGLILSALFPFFLPLQKIDPPSRAASSPSGVLYSKTQVEGDEDENGIPDYFEKRLAEKFNPCMVYVGEKIWAVDHRYLWAKKGDLRQRVYREEGSTPLFLKDVKIRDHSQLEKSSWAHLPRQRIISSEKGTYSYTYKYYIDGPGENQSWPRAGMTWDRQFVKIQGGDLSEPESCPYPPTQYAHFFWADLKKEILAIQYWFYYPYNKFINSHEGDWEHIVVYLQLRGKGKNRFDPRLNHQTPFKWRIYFHKFYIETDEVYRIGNLEGDSVPGDHAVIFVGGRGRKILPRISTFQGWWQISPLAFYPWGGNYSGGSYPWPGRYYGVGGKGPFLATEIINPLSRALHANQFEIVVLPEPDKVNYEKRPELSWFNLEFYSGLWTDGANAGLLRAAGSHRSPLQPAQKQTWNERKPYRPWPYAKKSRFFSYQPPSSWPLLHRPRHLKIK